VPNKALKGFEGGLATTLVLRMTPDNKNARDRRGKRSKTHEKGEFPPTIKGGPGGRGSALGARQRAPLFSTDINGISRQKTHCAMLSIDAKRERNSKKEKNPESRRIGNLYSTNFGNGG